MSGKGRGRAGGYAGGHRNNLHAIRSHGLVASADAPPGNEQSIDALGHQAAVRDFIRLRLGIFAGKQANGLADSIGIVDIDDEGRLPDNGRVPGASVEQVAKRLNAPLRVSFVSRGRR